MSLWSSSGSGWRSEKKRVQLALARQEELPPCHLLRQFGCRMVERRCASLVCPVTNWSRESRRYLTHFCRVYCRIPRSFSQYQFKSLSTDSKKCDSVILRSSLWWSPSPVHCLPSVPPLFVHSSLLNCYILLKRVPFFSFSSGGCRAQVKTISCDSQTTRALLPLFEWRGHICNRVSTKYDSIKMFIVIAQLLHNPQLAGQYVMIWAGEYLDVLESQKPLITHRIQLN